MSLPVKFMQGANVVTCEAAKCSLHSQLHVLSENPVLTMNGVNPFYSSIRVCREPIFYIERLQELKEAE